MKTKHLAFLIYLLLFTSIGFSQTSKLNDLVEEGITLHDKGEYEKAIKTYKKALRLDPNSSIANYEISYTYLSVKDYRNAEKYSKKVIDINEGNLLEAYINYGTALDLQGKTNKSIKAYEEAMKDFDNYLLYYNHAITCFNSGKTEKAYASVIQAINNNPSHASSHLILSKIMARKGIRIKAMLPLYFFLLIEPDTHRASIEYQTLRNYINHGVSQTGEKNISINVPINDDPDFGAAEMMVSLSKASNNLEENQEKTELALFAQNNDNLFKIMGELKKDKTGFWWDFYVTFFYELANESLTETYSYYISQSLGEEATEWFAENDSDFEKFKMWMNE